MTQMPNGKYQVVISLDNDIYWKLVKLGAEIQTPVEEYVRALLLGHVMEED